MPQTMLQNHGMAANPEVAENEYIQQLAHADFLIEELITENEQLRERLRT